MFFVIHLSKKLIIIIILILAIIFFSFLLLNMRLLPSYTGDMEFRVAVDPGHGSIDKGTSHRDIYEKDINLAIAKLLTKELKKVNIIPIMTRTEDKLYQDSRRADIRYRPKLANKRKADIFISLHVNNYSSSYPAGSQVFYKSGSEASKKLAKQITSELVQLRPENKRELKHGNYYVLNKASCPAVLIETGFLSNPEDRKKLVSDDYQRAVAVAIKNSIVKYFRSEMEPGSQDAITDIKKNKKAQIDNLSLYYLALNENEKDINLIRKNFTYPAGAILDSKFKNLQFNEILVRLALNQLIDDPPANLRSVFPAGTSVKSVSIENSTAIINFSHQLQTNFTGGAGMEKFIYQAITKTIFSIPGIDQLEILIGDKKGQSIGGHIILNKVINK